MKKLLTDPLLLVGSPAAVPDIRYAAGFNAPDAVVCLCIGNEIHLVVSALEYGRARGETSGVILHTPDSLHLESAKRRDPVAWTVALLKRLHVRRVRVPWDFPAGITLKLNAGGIRIEVIEGPAFPERAVKTRTEIECIRESQRAAVKAMKAACARLRAASVSSKGLLREGRRVLTSEELQLFIDRVLLESGCSADSTIAACGKQSADPHERGSGPLRAGEPVVIDIFPQHRGHGYFGDLTRTVVKGKPSPKVAAMYRAVKAAQEAALGSIRAGVRACEVHAAVHETFVRHGFQTGLIGGWPQGFIHGTGHGVGLAIHEAPSVSTAENILKAGNVITVEPGLYYRDTGGVRIEDTVVVTRTGWEYLCPFRKAIAP